MEDLKKAQSFLKKYFGFDKFRPAQEKVIKSILFKRDTLGVMPTGAGKSICFQIPALLFDGLTIVISPLISLMKDQVDALNTEGISATFLNSSLGREEINERLNEVNQGRYKLLYIAPERMGTYDISGIRQNRKVSMIVVDEAHCISNWGHDFRPSYREIFRFVAMFKPRPVVAAFTATATPKVREDILNFLKLSDPAVHISGFDRPNLFFKVLRDIDKDKFVLNYINEHSGDSGIIYAATQKEVERLHLFLIQNNIKAQRYHAGLSDLERTRAQDAFIYDRVDVIVATLAFGMGIDKSNIRYVIHYNMPKSVEGYYQEAGRAGRDGEKSECILLYSAKDVVIQKNIITYSYDETVVDKERIENNMALLQKMINYCHTPNCLRQYLLSYFNDENAVGANQSHHAPSADTSASCASVDANIALRSHVDTSASCASPYTCGACSNCLEETKEIDITTEAQMIFSCVYRMEERTGRTYGSSLTADVLAGSKSAKIKNFGFQNLSTYGLMKTKKSKEIRDLIDTLIAIGYLGTTYSEYSSLFLTDKAVNMLRNKEKLVCPMRIASGADYSDAQDALVQTLERDATFASADAQDALVQTPERRTRCASAGKERDATVFARRDATFASADVQDALVQTPERDATFAFAEISRKNVLNEDEEKLLFEKLRTIRKEIADKEHKPAFMIFSDATLKSMANKKPQNFAEFRNISGVGEKKLEAFGEIFLNAING